MTVEAIGVQRNTPEQISKQAKNEQTIQRVKAEFLRQVQEGTTEKEAFKNSLKAIDEKYNPQTDEFKCMKKDNIQEEYLCTKASKMQKINGETIKIWLEIIEKALPVIIKVVQALEEFVDWIITHKAPQENNPATTSTLANSTTA